MIVEILLATYNGEKYLEEQIVSLLNQTYTDLKIIIFDDCSTDKTVEIIKKLKVTDGRIKFYENTENLGYIKNFEKLIEMSQAEYFMLCDQDDVWLPNKVEVSLKKIREKQVDLVYTDLKVVDKNLRTIKESFNKSSNIFPEKINSIKECLFKNHATGCTMICSKNLKEVILPFIDLASPYYIHDWFILVCSYLKRGAYYLDEPTILYRQHGGNNVGYKRKRGLPSIEFIKKEKKKILESRVEFMNLLYKRFENNEFLEAKNYYKTLIETKILTFNFFLFNKIFRSEKRINKIKLFIVFHIPLYLLHIKFKDKID